jgi:DNA mismatch repair protein MutS2
MTDRKSASRSGKRPNRRAATMWAHTRKFREIDLHGMIVDQALLEVAETINEAVKHREVRIRINHGKGTGTLRTEIRTMLRQHPMVRGYRPASPVTGGDGVTEVDLRV